MISCEVCSEKCDFCWPHPLKRCRECRCSATEAGFNAGDRLSKYEIKEYRCKRIKKILEYQEGKYYGTAIEDEVYRLETILKRIYTKFEDV